MNIILSLFFLVLSIKALAADDNYCPKLNEYYQDGEFEECIETYKMANMTLSSFPTKGQREVNKLLVTAEKLLEQNKKAKSAALVRSAIKLYFVRINSVETPLLEVAHEEETISADPVAEKKALAKEKHKKKEKLKKKVKTKRIAKEAK